MLWSPWGGAKRNLEPFVVYCRLPLRRLLRRLSIEAALLSSQACFILHARQAL